MFVTFYSYKGGVGRTLALVNVAYLLATDREEPCRVLIWDFDLEAPGVAHLLPPKWGAHRLGFVDFVDRYCSEIQIPPISEYIHRTESENIDILPAGFVDEKYSSKLERINWQVLYERKRGYDLLESVKNSIENLEPRYDYILIDARTGYSDVGGICLQQLPTLVILMFRLNSQNLEGTAKTFLALSEFSKRTKKRLDVIPVISPTWPFATTEANQFIKRARTVFKPSRPLQISFDANLTLGEKIIVKDRHKYEIRPRTIDDYERVARRIRQQNLTDPFTMIQMSEEKQEAEQNDEAFAITCALVDRRPDRWKYWSLWTQIANKLPSQDKVLAFVEGHLTRNPRLAKAFVARARLHWTKWKEKVELLSHAIREDPDFELAYLDRGRALFREGQYRDALTDFNKYVSLAPKSNGEMSRGLCYLLLRDYANAEKDFRSLIESNPNDVSSHFHLALTKLISGDFNEAQSECERALELDPNDENAKLVLIHVFARARQPDRARVVLDEMISSDQNRVGSLLNLAEACVALEDSDRARSLIDRAMKTGRRLTGHQIIADLLRHFCNKLQGIKDEELEGKVLRVPQIKQKMLRSLDWRFIELRSFLLYPGEDSKLTQSMRQDLLNLVESYENVPIGVQYTL
jgi:pentatricopeptide repeat protein